MVTMVMTVMMVVDGKWQERRGKGGKGKERGGEGGNKRGP
jgi:hypothetical protein